MSPHDARLAPAAGAAWLAAACAWLGWGPWPVAVGVVLLGAGMVRRSARPALAVACAAGVTGWCAGATAFAATGPVRDAVGTTVTLAAVADSDASPGVAGPTEGLWRVELVVVAVDGVGAHARVVVWGDETWRSVVRGERLSVRGRLAAASGGATALTWRPSVVARDGPHDVDALVAGLRAGLREATGSLPPRLQPLTRGMVIGDDSGMASAQREQLSRAGLTHLTAVSGSHFAIVLVAVTAGTRLLVRNRRVVAAVSGVAMGLLVSVVFPEPSVMRAATMAVAVCAALWWGRPAQALPALSCGIVAVAVLDPRLACEPGFAMSAAAVAAIALWAPALAVRLAPHVPAAFAHPLAVCIAAQAAVLPLLALIDGGVGPWSVAANLAVGWCAAPVTLIGLAALVIAPLSPGLAQPLATVSGWCAWPVDAAAQAADRLPGAALTVPPGAWGAAASALVVGLFVTLTFAVRLRLGMLVAAGAVGLVVLAIPLAPALFAPRAPGDWLVVACDVGQGDAMLLRSGPQSAVVVDVGPADGGGPECLARYGVRRIDLLILTHPHADHDGAVAEIVGDVPVSAAWISPAGEGAAGAGAAGEGAVGDGAAAALERAGVPVRVVHEGDAATVGEVAVVVLGPGAGMSGATDTGLNDASVVTHASVGGVTVLGLGDLEHEGQRELARRLSSLVVDVVKVAHHGSDRQEGGLASMVSARVAVVSVGANNSYGHPSPGALEMWGPRVGAVLRTDRCGDIVITPGPSLATACPSDMAG